MPNKEDEQQGDTSDLDISSFSGLLSNLTHELKTPLHSILSLANILRSEIDGTLNDEQKRQVEMIQGNGEQLFELISELLNISTLAARARRVRVQSFDIRLELLSIAASLKPVAQQKGITLETDLEKLASAFRSDRFLVRQVVTNLLANAIKHTLGGNMVWLYGESLEGGLEDGAVRLHIVDSGSGIPRGRQEVVFDELCRIGSKGEQSVEGVGLGLSLVRASLKQLGGSIELKSEVGQGSLFVVNIPESKELSKCPTVLILDADECSREVLRTCLERECYKCIAPEGARFSHQALSDVRPDLVLIDIEKFTRNNIDFIKEIRSLQKDKIIPVIGLSALDRPKERDYASEIGVDDLLIKPFDAEEVVLRVAASLYKYE